LGYRAISGESSGKLISSGALRNASGETIGIFYPQIRGSERDGLMTTVEAYFCDCR
jgi:hypothetical protein